MNQLNSLILEGNVVKHGKLEKPLNGFCVLKFSVSVIRFKKNSEGEDITEISYFDIEAYGKIAEKCEKEISNGKTVRIVGRLKQNIWNDENNNKHSKVFIIAEHIEFKLDNSDSVA